MEKATDNEPNAHYNDEVLFLDEIVESHPKYIICYLQKIKQYSEPTIL